MYKTPANLSDFSYKNIPDIQNKRILLRTCLNVTVTETGEITDHTRLFESLPLIKELAGKAKNLVITAHLGRPEKQEHHLNFMKICEKLNEELGKHGFFVKLIDNLTPENFKLISINNTLESNVIFLLDNIRFFEGEETKEADKKEIFSKQLASLGEVFINDAFADYRASASTYDVAKLLPSYLGPVFLREVEALGRFNNPENPFIAILGGAKLSEKLDALEALAKIADKVLIGGAMAYTFMKAKGLSIGNSRFEEDKVELAKRTLDKYSDKLVLPIDHLELSAFKESADYTFSDTAEIDSDKIGADIGWKTIDLFKKEVANAKSILWNGPMGVFEWEHPGVGTKEIGSAIGMNNKAYKLVGGGDSIAAINKYNLSGFDHISTGGGAMLAFLAYEEFPTLDVIINK
jgi:phosphoglycerate kinase